MPDFVVEVAEPLQCRLDPDAYFMEVGPEQAQELCAGCPVFAECRAYGLGDPRLVGVWGGLSGSERKALRRSSG